MEENSPLKTYFSKSSIDDSTHCHCGDQFCGITARYAFLHATPNRFSKTPVRVSRSSYVSDDGQTPMLFAQIPLSHVLLKFDPVLQRITYHPIHYN
eukprot:scaffold3079_cov174-Amphora_coffeaeformis.AAC.21